MERYGYREVDGEILPPDEGVYLDETLLHEAAVDLHDEFYTEWYEQQAAEAASPAVPVRLAEEYRHKEPWAVDRKDRTRRILAAADMYAKRASLHGLKKYTATKRGADDMAERYDDVEYVVSQNAKNTRYTNDQERYLLAPALGYDAKTWVNGEYPAGTEADAQNELILLRHEIGVYAGREKRNKVRKKLKEVALKNTTKIELDFPKFL